MNEGVHTSHFSDLSDKKIAIVADWLIDFGGAELVIEELLAMFPQAEIFTSVCFMQHKMLEWRKVHTSFIQKIPFLNKKHKLAGLLRPWAFRRFDLSDFDVVICSSSAESKNVALGRHASLQNGARNTTNRKFSEPSFQKWEDKAKTFQQQEDQNEDDIQNIQKQENQDSQCLSAWLSSSVNTREIRDDEDIQNAQKPENYNENEQKTIQKQEIRGDEDFSTGVYWEVNDWEKSDDNEEVRRLWIVCVYCHTPIRYYWSHYEEYKNMMEFGIFNPLIKWIFPKVVGWMRKLDYEAAQAVDVFWGNSQTTAERIRTFYHRDAKVIYPGIDVDAFSSSREKWDFYLGIGRCIPYKKFDLLVDAFNLNGKKLILCTNTDNLLYRELKAKSQPNIEWIFAPSIEKRNELYRRAKAFLFPPEEDFGLVPVEAMASGTPVIAYGVGGATETVIDGKTGVFFAPQTPEALNKAIEAFETLTLDQKDIIARGHQFSTKNFRKQILESIDKHLNND